MTLADARDAQSDLPKDDWDPLQGTIHPELHYGTSNAGESMPGLLTPLAWSLWGPVSDNALRVAAHAMGVLSRVERRALTPRILEVFRGRAAMQVEFFAMLGDRLPGTTGAEVAHGLFGRVPEDLEFRPTRRRYPVIAWRFPVAFCRSPARLRTMAAAQDAWWKRSVAGVESLDLAGARRLFVEAEAGFREAAAVHGVATFAGLQPVHDALGRLLARVHTTDDLSILTSPAGGAEMAVVQAIWDASRGVIGVDDVVREHGFHGPGEGDIGAEVWRDDPTPLRRMIDQYAQRGDEENPHRHDAEREAERARAEHTLIAEFGVPYRPVVRAVLLLARTRLPLRGVGKRAFLQGIDVARAAARRIGRLLAAHGVLEGPEDVFYLTVAELVSDPPPDVRDLVRRRRERREQYGRGTIPTEWKGRPRVLPVAAVSEPPAVTGVRGIGVSSGVVEGPVRVVADPGFDEVEPDEILVATTTDPSWCSIMFVSSALVVDIGGPLSHAAVVAREMGIPCVVNTRDGTRVLRTGDVVRVDGTAGTVTVLQRATPPPS